MLTHEIIVILFTEDLPMYSVLKIADMKGDFQDFQELQTPRHYMILPEENSLSG